MTDIELKKKWSNCLAYLREKIDSHDFSTWFSALSVNNYTHESLVLSVPNKIIIEFIQNNFAYQLQEAVEHCIAKPCRIQFIIAPDVPKNESSTQKKQVTKFDTQLNEELTMESFVLGKANKLAHTVATGIVKNPGKMSFNPFFLYGASGVGKTHLINAIGLEIVRQNPEKRVLYVPAHLFKVQYMDAYKSNKHNDFIHFYQSIDVLIVDDIQEFTTKGTQQAFFHVFNHLQLNARQIIISSDRSPSEFEGIEERMLTRFKAGIVAEIERPDLALRRAIIQAKMIRDGLQFPKECVDYIVTHVESSVRELQGIINSIMAFAVSNDTCDITLELTERVVSRAINLEKRQLTIDNIFQTVCKHFSLTTKEVLSKSRKQAIVQARQVAMFLCHKYTDKSYSEIGRQLGKKDHSTVLHSCEVVNTRMNAEKNYRKEVECIEASLKN